MCRGLQTQDAAQIHTAKGGNIRATRLSNKKLDMRLMYASLLLSSLSRLITSAPLSSLSPFVMASGRPGETIDLALGAAAPILDILETALDLAPVPGLGLIPKALSALVDRVKVRSIVNPSPCATSISAKFSVSL